MPLTVVKKIKDKPVRVGEIIYKDGSYVFVPSSTLQNTFCPDYEPQLPYID